MNREYSHCCIHNKTQKLMEDEVSGWMCLCACLHPYVCEEKKASLAEEFPGLNQKRKTESRQNKDVAKSISRGEKPTLIVGLQEHLHAQTQWDPMKGWNNESIKSRTACSHKHSNKEKQNHICPSLLSDGGITSDVRLALFLCSNRGSFFKNRLLGNWNKSLTKAWPSSKRQ